MTFRAYFAVSTVLFASTALAQAQGSAAESPAGATTQIQIAQKTDVPGTSLSPGSYTVSVEDRLKDRVIVQVQKRGSQSFLSLLSYSNQAIATGSASGPITFSSGLNGKPTMRGFAFPGGPVVEFIYPKKDAVTLAKANNVRVMAVDPASEGMASLPHLTQSDMAEVTLWMLTPTPVEPGSSKPGIQAAKYQAPSPSYAQPVQQAETGSRAQISPRPQPSYRASAQPGVSRRSAYNTSSTANTTSSTNTPVEVASNTPPHRLRPNVKQLPHTASNLPLLFLVGLLSLGSASLLTLRRSMAALKA